MSDLDAIRILRALEAAGVQYLLIGGFATVIHGYERATADLDICYERSQVNVRRLAAILQELHAQPRDWPQGVPFVLDARTIANGDSFTFTTDAGDLDVLATPAGSNGFGDLLRDSIVVELADGLAIRVIGLDDLIRIKRAAGRGKDLVDAAALEAIRDGIENVDRD